MGFTYPTIPGLYPTGFYPSMPPPAPPTPTTSGNGMLWVNSKQEADAYRVVPGGAVALWDANSPFVYLRQADSTGKPSTTVFELVERAEEVQPPQAPQPDLSQYITRSEFEAILAERLTRPMEAVNQKEDTDNG